jgi:uncharacterized membrane protein
MKSRAHFLALAVVWVMIFAYGIYFSAYSIQRQRAFLTNASDLGQIDQALWNTTQGRPLEFTRRTGEESIRLTDHVEPIFIPASLVLLAYDNVEALLILQSFVIALGALPVFWIARQRLRPVREDEWGDKIRRTEFLSLGFAAMYLLFPSLEAANLAEFHAVTFAPVLLLCMYHYGTLKQWVRFALFAFLALMVKEEISTLVFTMAGWFVISDFRFQISDLKTLPIRFFNYLKTAPRVPMMFAALSLIWFGLTFFVIIPHFNAQGFSPYTCRYVVGDDCPQVAKGLFLEQRLSYLVQLLASSGFVSLLDPISLLLGSPIIIANVISNFPAQYSGTFHYSAPVAPYFVIAAIGGTAWLLEHLQRSVRSPQRTQTARYGERAALGVAIALALGYHVIAGYTPLGRAYAYPVITAHDELFQRFAAQIPPDAKLSTTSALHPHLSHREFLYRFPVVNDADYVLLDLQESDRGIPGEFRIAYDTTLKNNFGVIDAADGYVLLKRGAPARNLPDAFFTPFRVPSGVSPQYPMQIDFGDAIRFLGYDVLTDSQGRGYMRTYWERLKQLNQNYYLFPFVADAQGNPITDLNFPMTVLFWYPSAAWKRNQVVVGRTVPLEWGERARLGVGVTDGRTWDNTDARLPITHVEPSNLQVMDGTWVDLGEFMNDGNGYEKIQ